MAKIIYLFLIVSVQLYAQIDRIMELYPLELIDRITENNCKDFGQEIDSLQNPNYFFLSNYQEEEGLYFVKKEGSEWLVFDFQLNLNYGPNTLIKNIKIENDRFIRIETLRFSSGTCPGQYGMMTLLDVKSCSTIKFCNYQQMECYDQDGDISSRTACTVEFLIDNEFIKIQNKSKEVDLDCVESSEYRIEQDRFVKSKYYSRSSKRLYNVNCIDKICTGMLFADIKKVYENASIKQSALYEYGYDSDKPGSEIWIEDEIHFFVIQSDGIVAGLSVISSLYSFNGINTISTVSSIFEKYPEAKLYVDLISNWEYIYLKKEDIRLVFKTDRDNRIGVYDSDPEDAANGIKRKDVKIDLIQI